MNNLVIQLNNKKHLSSQINTNLINNSITKTENKVIAEHNFKSIYNEPNPYQSYSLVVFKGKREKDAIRKANALISSDKNINEDERKQLSNLINDYTAKVYLTMSENNKQVYGGQRFLGFTQLNILKNTTANNKEAVALIIRAKKKNSNEKDKYFATTQVKSAIKTLNKDKINVVKAIINPTTGIIDSRFNNGTVSLSDFLNNIDSKNSKMAIELLNKKTVNGKPLLGLDVILNRINSNTSLKETSNVSITTKSTNIDDYILTKNNSPRDLAVLNAIYDYADKLPFKKIIEGKDINDYSYAEKLELAKFLKKVDYKKIVGPLKYTNNNRLYLPNVENQTDVLVSVLDSLKPAKFSTEDNYKFIEEIYRLDNNLKNADISDLNSHKNNNLKGNINQIILMIPELDNVFYENKDNHKTLKIELLKSLQELTQNDKYLALEGDSKEVTKFGFLFSELPEKQENKVLIARLALSRLHFKDRKLDKIIDLAQADSFIKEGIDNSKSPRNIVNEYFRRPGIFEISKIIATSKIVSGQKRIEDKYKLSQLLKDIQKEVDNVVNTTIMLPQTRVPKASELINVPNIELGITQKTKNKIIELNEDSNLESIGFDKGANGQNSYFVIHAINKNMDKLLIDAMAYFKAIPDTNYKINNIIYDSKLKQGVYSASYISAKDNNIFQRQKTGFIFDVDPANIAVISNSDLGSGFSKTEPNFIRTINDSKRKKFSECIKNEMRARNYQDIDNFYLSLYGKDRNKAINEMDPNTASVFQDVICNKIMQQNKNDYAFADTNNNELMVRAPKVTAIFAKDIKADDISYELRKYAQDNDLPIITLQSKSDYNRGESIFFKCR